MNEKIIIRILLKWKIEEEEEISVQEKSRKEGAWRPDAWVKGEQASSHCRSAGLQLPPAIE